MGHEKKEEEVASGIQASPHHHLYVLSYALDMEFIIAVGTSGRAAASISTDAETITASSCSAK